MKRSRIPSRPALIGAGTPVRLLSLPLVLTFVLLVPGVPLASGTLSLELTFEPAQLTMTPSPEGSLVSLPGWTPVADRQGFLLPQQSVIVPLPRGEKVVGLEVSVRETAEIPLAGIPRRVPGDPLVMGAPPDGEPEALVSLGAQGSMGGEGVAVLVFRGIRFDPVGQSLLLYPRVEVTLRFGAGPPGHGAEAPLRQSERASNLRAGLIRGLAGERALSRIMEVPSGGEMLGEFGYFLPGQYPSLDGSLVEYLIVTTEELAAEFQRLADWKTRKGVPAAVRTVEEIEAVYPGLDRQERVRNFLRDAYRYWGTTWVLLGGDEPLIPTRLAHTTSYGGEDISTDLYYTTLDGTWDGDGDGVYGEGYHSSSDPGDSLDLFPDVFVGRAPVETVEEVETFVDKTINYVRSPLRGYQTDALFIADVVFPNPWDPPDPIYLNGCDIAQNSAEWVPSTWDTIFLCEWPHQNENHEAVVNALQESANLVTVVGHGDPFKWSTSDDNFFTIDDAIALSNTSKYFVLFFANCNINQVETEAVNEYLLLDDDGGAIATLAATRYDFPTVGQYYHEEFFRLLFTTETAAVGALHALMKVFRIPECKYDTYDRWTQLTYILLGDPELEIWKVVPRAPSLIHPDTMALGDSTLTVTVRQIFGQQPAEGALVTLWKPETGEYSRGLTDANGEVELDFRPGSTGTVLVTSTHPSLLPAADSLQVVAGAPRLFVSQVTVDDDSLGSSAGNGNGVLEGGERAELLVTLENGSGSPADSVTGTLLLPPGGEIRAYLTVDGVPDTGLVFLGEAKELPSSLPATLTFAGDSLSAWGKPHYVALASEDTIGSPVTGRAYLWQDASGWHLRGAGAQESHTLGGYLATDGSWAALSPWGLEDGDVLWPEADSVFFTFYMDSTDFEDGVDLIAGDSLGGAILAGAAEYGSVAAGGTATDTFLVEVDSGVADERAWRLVLSLEAAGGVLWDRGFRLDLASPVLTPYFHRLDDSLPGGDGDGFAEPGETVSLTPLVENAGSGRADAVTAVLRALSGATVPDSMVVLGDIEPGTIGEAPLPFTVVFAESVAQLELDLLTVYGQGGTFAFEAGVGTTPASPTGLTMETGDTWAELGWDPSSASDLRGYNVYRATPGRALARVNRELTRSAYLRDEGLSPESPYVYQVSAVDSAGNETPLSESDTAYTGPPLQEGFPVLAWNQVYSSPLPVDVDVDGDREIVLASKGWRAFIWAPDGALMPGWPTMMGDETISSPAVGNLDEDPQREIVIGDNDKKLYVWNHDGTGLLEPSGVFASTGKWIQCTPALGDLDKDGDLEIVVASNDGWLYAWHGDGSAYLLPGGGFAEFPGNVVSSPALADVDGDTYLEIFLCTTAGVVYAWNHNGSAFRLPSGQFKYVGGGPLWSAPALGDVDDDDEMELVVASMNSQVYVYDMSANEETGWPKSTGNSIRSSPALGDLDRDGDLEIVVGSDDGKLYAWHHYGLPVVGFPKTLPDSVIGSPAVGDINGDSYPDVVVGCADHRVYAFQRDGTPVDGWPMRTYDKIYHSGTAIADLDVDGDVEVIQASYDGYVYVWDLSAPYDVSTMDWPVFSHDRCRTGFAAWTDPDGPTTVPGGGGLTSPVPLVTGLRGVLPNPANPQTVISFDLSQSAHVVLSLFDVEGRLVRVLVDGTRPAGRHGVSWEGRTRRGRQAASGIYFVQMRVGGEDWTEKLVVVR